ncbi:30 kDa spicule matrix protein-like [Diadema setosum]|uniref:30 kDa spicule matrix protein-like n=1 Tax=Diadema setosum TaxID=31175 RepID=UPI003B3B0357
MRSFVALFGCLLALVAVSHAQLGQGCERFWTEYDGSCYQLSHGGFMRGAFGGAVFAVEGLSQRAANQFCGREKPGASLVTVNSHMENDFLYEWTLRTNLEPQPVWLGLHVNPMTRQWEWYSGEPVNYTNWDEIMVYPEFGTGALLFDADPRLQMQNAVDVSARWVPEQILGENHYFICEYKLQSMQMPTMDTPTTFSPNGTQGTPMMLENNPVNAPQQQRQGAHFQELRSLRGVLGTSGLAGSRLHEVPKSSRVQRPAAYRKGRFFGAFP